MREQREFRCFQRNYYGGHSIIASYDPAGGNSEEGFHHELPTGLESLQLTAHDRAQRGDGC